MYSRTQNDTRSMLSFLNAKKYKLNQIAQLIKVINDHWNTSLNVNFFIFLTENDNYCIEVTTHNNGIYPWERENIGIYRKYSDQNKKS